MLGLPGRETHCVSSEDEEEDEGITLGNDISRSTNDVYGGATHILDIAYHVDTLTQCDEENDSSNTLDDEPDKPSWSSLT